MEKLKKFFREVIAEAKKTTWPNREELLASTGVVFIYFSRLVNLSFLS